LKVYLPQENAWFWQRKAPASPESRKRDTKKRASKVSLTERKAQGIEKDNWQS
jgi:hypothetical protein